ncbi:MAG: ABC transporter permease [Candidatus Aminicenantes bacterium]|nr:ABC transporter permease [Candidatus Aminicenantes bacterium]
MIKNYLKTALRNIKKHKAYSVINIAGLAVGMACCMLIILFVRDELSYDRYHEKAERIYRLVDAFDMSGGLSRYFALSSAPFAPALIKEFPEVEDAVRLIPGRRRLVAYGENKHYEDNLFFADASLFHIFTFPLLKGDAQTALKSPHTIVISEKTARKYFGSEDPMDKVLQVNEQDYVVTGVMENMPENSHFQADIFTSMATLEKIPSLQENYFQSWARHEFYTYLLLQEGFDFKVLESKLPGFIDRHAAAQIQKILGSTLSSKLQPLTSIHLYSERQYEVAPNGDIKNVKIFSLIALFILLLACINYMNLATARSVKRSREVGLRKVVGAGRSQIAKQFLGESLFFTFFALFLALIFFLIALPFFNGLTGKHMTAHRLSDPYLLTGMAVILLFVGLASGSYPAFFISRFQPVHALKSSPFKASTNKFLRKGLVILQFCISIGLIISTLVVFKQLDFLRNKKLGFDKEHVVVIPIRSGKLRTNYESVKAELLRNPDITNATISIGVPGGIVAGDAIQLVTDEGKKTLTVRMIYTDHDFIKTMGMEIVKGRNFSKEKMTDTNSAFIINEAAVQELNLASPLETRFEWGDKKGKVIGVVKDFQFRSLREKIDPLIIHIWPHNTFVFAVRIRPENIQQTLAFIENKWRELDPAHPFEYSFLDDTFEKIYRNEEKLGRIFGIFSMLAIFIGCLGLFGLALFMVEQRTKEIGIRKVLGAPSGNLFFHLSKEFVLLVLVANIFAWPITYFLMRRWLQNFAYRVGISPWIFLLSAAVAFGISFLTVSFQAVKAASANPVDSLRYE